MNEQTLPENIAKPTGKRNRGRKKPDKTTQPADADQPAEMVPPPLSSNQITQPLASRAHLRLRHVMVMFSFLVMVIAPAIGTYVYLYRFASDQYISEVGFSVQKEETGSAIDIIGGISQISNGSSSDTDILYEFIQSQQMVLAVSAKLDLRALYSKPESDPIFSLLPDASQEELVEYWNRMVRIFYNGSNGLIQLRIHAFEANDAHMIAQEIFSESSNMINGLSAIAQKDATRYASEELMIAVERLKEARQDLITFRHQNQIVDPNADLQLQMGLLNTLQTQQAQTLIEADLLRQQSVREDDPRSVQIQLRAQVIRDRIEAERLRFTASPTGEAESYSTLIGRYEGLTVEKEFAESFYVSALAAYDTARAEGQRQSRYLAAYVGPTLAQTPQYPEREILLSLVAFFAFLIWAVLVLAAYAIRDRR